MLSVSSLSSYRPKALRQSMTLSLAPSKPDTRTSPSSSAR